MSARHYNLRQSSVSERDGASHLFRLYIGPEDEDTKM